ncbi:MAG: T9SS type A sorting domain-containing protein, partial [Candidatus Marinimicrobia bacterium]|nr:T9SS type A sorting domain-containing protein [Candidatus Neomarinimicrobiota bacterium]
VNLGCLESAIVTGSVDTSLDGGKHPDDILWDPATNAYKRESSWHEYGLGYNKIMGGVTEENPMWWMVEWPTAKNINYITATGCYGNQPQPHTGWAIQIDSAGTWKNLAKSDNGWADDNLRGIGGWINDGLMELRLMQPVVTTKLRFCAFANPDSLLDGVETFADSLWSFSFTGLKKSASAPHACLIQYLDFSGATADNDKDAMVNLGLIDEAVVSASFDAGEIDNIRGAPTELLFDPVKGDFHYTGTPWGEFGYPWQYDAGYVEYEDPFYWMIEWPVPKNINYFTWGGVYGNQPQPTTLWAVEYWDDAWVALMDGVGGSYLEGLSGVDTDAESVWQSDTPVQTTKFRLAVWSDGIDPLFSYHIRGRGGSCQNWDETDSTFKCILVQYKDLATAIGSDDLVKPTEFALHQNYPNPFNPTTNIGFLLEKQSHVRLTVYNLLGQEIAVLVDAMRSSGYHHVSFDAKSLSSGVYLYQLETNQGILTKKMLLFQ